MRGILYLLIFFGVLVPYADAHIPVLIEQSSLRDITLITEPEISKAFYGTLDGFPHTYEIRSAEPFTLFAEVRIPNIAESTPIVSGIIIKEVGERGRVAEVARLLARDALWESFYEPFGGDSYRRGASYESELEAGVYRIEVTTPDNDEKYVLVVGKEEDFGGVGYFETIRRIGAVKVFFGKSKLMIIQSPFVYIPIGILMLIGAVMVYRRRSHTTA